MIKICTACDEDKLVTDFEYRLNAEGTVQCVRPCKDCRGIVINDPVDIAEQQYYAAIYMMIMLGFGSHEKVSRREQLQREYGGLLERLQRKYVPGDPAMMIEYYRKLRYNINAQIKRHERLLR